ncbi:hypothetical protein ON010_g12132 [Phytophthora cinnamomi]|nr:hypothetical protein ON010_g12132 [Phytophthora cinnamomi]
MASIEVDFEEGEWPFGGDGEPEDVLVPIGAACTKINEILASADESAGEYSFGGRADTLPVAPGLVINGVGEIGVPLGQEQAEKLIAKGEKSPFGHNYDTKMDENVRKSWQIAPDQVEIANPLWAAGLEELTAMIAQRLGYDSVPLLCFLYKLLVYGEGGHFVKHQDTEKEDGMIATLVVQLPSSHEGGDLVVYRGGKERYRHDFGKAEGTAAFFPHYAVHYADAQHALEEVTKGYRLALVYSICLPTTMRHLEKDSNAPTSDDLMDAISEMEEGKESLALLLEQEYSPKSIGKLGMGALKHIDSARFRALSEANTAVPADKKLEFFLAKLSHKIVSCPMGAIHNDWKEEERKQSIHWYSSSGEGLGRLRDAKLKCKLNFLNPSRATFTQLWEPHGDSNEEPYTGNEGPTRNTKYSRFAIVAWPAVQHAENALNTMTVELAVEALVPRKPIDAAVLRTFLDVASKKLGTGKQFSGSDAKASYCPRLGELSENTSLIPGLTKVVKEFDWNDIGAAMLDILGHVTHEYQEEDFGESELELTLQVIDGLDDGAALQALLKMAVALAIKDDTTDPESRDELVDLNTSKVTGILWKHAISSTDCGPFEALINHFLQKDPSVMGPMIEVFSQYVDDLDEVDGKFTGLASIATRRAKWLKSEIRRLDKPFSWEMVDARFPGNPKIEAFLRGPDTSMKIVRAKPFTGLPEARKYAADCVRGMQDGASFTMKPAGKGKQAYVTISKTKKWYNDCQKKVREYQAERTKLKELYKEGKVAKRARTE